MCGVFGVIYGPDGPQAEVWSPEEFCMLMFPAIVHRGRDAFGYMYEHKDEVGVAKFQGAAVGRKAMNKIRVPDDASWVMGHVRLATHGSPAYRGNNHPLVHGNYVGIHNGMISNYSSILAQTGREDPKAEVDSEAIFAAVQKWGLIKGLARLYGGIATGFVNIRRPRTVYLARSYSSPLHIATTDSGSLMFASECKVMECTGVKLGPSSAVGQHRLLTVRNGKVVKRQQYATPDSGFYSFGDSPKVARPYKGVRTGPGGTPAPLFQNPLRGITDRLEKASDPEKEIREIERQLAVIKSSRADGEAETRKGNRYRWYHGVMLTEEQYQEAVELDHDLEAKRLEAWLKKNSYPRKV